MCGDPVCTLYMGVCCQGLLSLYVLGVFFGYGTTICRFIVFNSQFGRTHKIALPLWTARTRRWLNRFLFNLFHTCWASWTLGLALNTHIPTSYIACVDCWLTFIPLCSFFNYPTFLKCVHFNLVIVVYAWRCEGCWICYCKSQISLIYIKHRLDHTSLQNYDFPNNLEDYVHRIGRTGVGNDPSFSLISC